MVVAQRDRVRGCEPTRSESLRLPFVESPAPDGAALRWYCQRQRALELAFFTRPSSRLACGGRGLSPPRAS